MDTFDKIIGYSAIKKELERIADVLRGNEAYEKLGVKNPRGLLLHGEPGLGKTLMASCLIEASGRNSFRCRKNRPNGDFVNTLRETFQKAKENAPSIVFLDDMDKFANGDEMHRNAEEYVTIQSCIDEIKDCDVFVLATANNLRNLPRSLLRAGRFDRVIEIEAPAGEDAVAIIEHYMKNKNFSSSIDAKLIARLMKGNSCAELEAVINEAGMYAGFDRSCLITTDHFMKACMKLVFDVPTDAFDREDTSGGGLKNQVAYHEAGHAVIQEVLDPGSVSLVAIYKTGSQYNGITSFSRIKTKTPVCHGRHRALGALGGMAAVEQVFGVPDGGSSRDLDRAFNIIGDLVKELCVAGFHLHHNGQDSEELHHQQELAIAAEVERAYREAKEILSTNSAFLHRLANELLEKEVLNMFDVERIRKECFSDATVSA